MPLCCQGKDEPSAKIWALPEAPPPPSSALHTPWDGFGLKLEVWRELRGSAKDLPHPSPSLGIALPCPQMSPPGGSSTARSAPEGTAGVPGGPWGRGLT